MAYLSATDLNDIQEVGGTDEKRYSPLGLVDAVKDSTAYIDFISPSKKAEMQKLSSARSLQLPVIKDQQVSVVTTPGFNFIPSNMPESAQYTFAAVDLFSGFRFYPASYEDNAIDMNWEKTRRIKAVLYQMGIAKEALIQSVMESRKTQLWNGTVQVSQGDGTFSFDGGTDILSINKAAQKETMFSNIDAMFDINELGGGLRYVANRGGFQVQMMEALKYGANNDKNLAALGLPDPSRYYQTGNIAAGSDVFNGYVFRDGAIGLVENFPYDFRANTVIGGKEWSISDMEMPWTRSRVNVFVNTQAAEGTSLIDSSNMKMTNFQEMAMWDRFYIVYPYNSDLSTRANDIVKIKGLTA
jgi:hypothetical protein